MSEDWSKWVGIPSSFVEISLEIHASVSRHMHKGNAMLHNFTLAPSVNPSILFICSLSFPPTPLIVFLVAKKKCAMLLSEPLVDHQPRSEMVEEVDVTWGSRGYRHSYAVNHLLSV